MHDWLLDTYGERMHKVEAHFGYKGPQIIKRKKN